MPQMTVTGGIVAGSSVGTVLAVDVLNGAAGAALQAGGTFSAEENTHTPGGTALFSAVGTGSWLSAVAEYGPATAPGGTITGTTILSFANASIGAGIFRNTAGTTAGSSTGVSIGATTPACTAGEFAVAEILAAAGQSISLDGSTPAAVSGTTLTVSTAQFSPPPGALLVACAGGYDGGLGVITSTISDSLGLTWTLLVARGIAGQGVAAIYIAQVPFAPAAAAMRYAPGWHPGWLLPGMPGGTPFLAQPPSPLSPPPLPEAAAAAAVQRPSIRSRLASRARLGPQGLCAAGLAVAVVTQAAAAPPAQRPPRPPPARAHAGPQGRNAGGIASAVVTPLGSPARPRPFVFRSSAPRRGQWRAGTGPAAVTAVAVTAYQRPPPQPRRPAPARAVWHGSAAPQVVAIYRRPLPQVQHPAPRRALWRGYASRVVTPLGTPGPPWRAQPRRPGPARAAWHGNAGPAAVVPPAPQAYQHPPGQARRPAPRRGQWHGNASHVVTPLGTPAARPAPKITSRPRARALWHGGAGPQPAAAAAAAAAPRRVPQPSRRKPGRAVWRYVRGLVNAPPPPPSPGILTAATAPGSTLTAADASGSVLTAGTGGSALTAATAAQDTLTAGTQSTGGPS